ncbi:GDP-mannose mannosyl hydrolase [Paenalcaligenes faecalis]|uniref:GDP-mannose mannosyl hydrolase n=1 Tax=Paenalcaligenes faecalis TaxID=2980099 RepID=UPI0022B9D3F4|nr:GDP-mannose mannosyl hydrolase [Paenalcaligenes faecalis]
MSDNEFQKVISLTPLISLDLIVQDEDKNYLLGLRKNRPAQGYWFVPGGRIQKNETIAQAFSRLAQEELGVELCFEIAQFQGVYEHFYEDSVFKVDASTHYIALAYRVVIKQKMLTENRVQHHKMQWFNLNNLLSSKQVHPYTKQYFEKGWLL